MYDGERVIRRMKCNERENREERRREEKGELVLRMQKPAEDPVKLLDRTDQGHP